LFWFRICVKYVPNCLHEFYQISIQLLINILVSVYNTCIMSCERTVLFCNVEPMTVAHIHYTTLFVYYDDKRTYVRNVIQILNLLARIMGRMRFNAKHKRA